MGAAVDNQRWTMETLSSTNNRFTYRIRNTASGRCLDKPSTGRFVVIADCGEAASQKWSSPAEEPMIGWRLVNLANDSCLQIADESYDVGGRACRSR